MSLLALKELSIDNFIEWKGHHMSTEQYSTGRDKLIDSLKHLIKDAEDLLKNTGQQADSGYQSARARFESTLQNAKSGLDAAQEKVAARAKGAAETTDRYVQENPWQAMGIGAIAGILVGLLIGRK